MSLFSCGPARPLCGGGAPAPVPRGALAALNATTDGTSDITLNTATEYNVYKALPIVDVVQSYGSAIIASDPTQVLLAQPGTYQISYVIPLVNTTGGATSTTVQAALGFNTTAPTAFQSAVTLPSNGNTGSLSASVLYSTNGGDTVSVYAKVSGVVGFQADIVAGTYAVLTVVQISAQQLQ